MKPKVTFREVAWALALSFCILLTVPFFCGKGISIRARGRYYVLSWVGLGQLHFGKGVAFAPDGKEVNMEFYVGPFVMTYGKFTRQ